MLQIQHKEDLESLREKLEEELSTKIAVFFLRNNVFAFNDKLKLQILGTTFDFKFAVP